MPHLRLYKSKRRRKSFKGNIKSDYASRRIIHLLIKEFELLTEWEKDEIKSYYYSKSKAEISELLESNKILPFGSHILTELDCDKDFWKSKHDFFFDRNSKIKDLLNLIFKDLDLALCKSVALTENFSVLLTTNSCLGCFSSGDVDISANISERTKIIGCLNKFGFYSEDNSSQIREYSGQSMQFLNKEILDDGFWINVIWKPVTRAFLVQDKYDLRLDRERKNFKIIENTRIRVLEDTALMYFCCLHISAGHYFTLTPGSRLYYDIDRLASHGNINWDKIKLWESQDKAGLRVSFVLILCQKMFNSCIPVDIFEAPLKKYRNRVFLNYLFDEGMCKMQDRSSLIRRLFIELLSDDRNILFSFFNRIFKYINVKLT